MMEKGLLQGQFGTEVASVTRVFWPCPLALMQLSSQVPIITVDTNPDTAALRMMRSDRMKDPEEMVGMSVSDLTGGEIENQRQLANESSLQTRTQPPAC